MAGACIRCSLYRNLSPGGKDERVKGLPGAPTKGSNTLTPFPPVSQAQTLTPPLVLSSTKELCQQLLKTYAATVKLLE